MREDMFKVIVERPRLIHGNWLGGGREPGFRQRMAREDVPAKVGMRASHDSRKWLNENLTPLRRFLEKQVGRPWNKVHAELLQGIDQRNTVQQHILTHIENFVLIHVQAEQRFDKRGRQRGVRFLARERYGELRPVEESGRPLFVDPRTDLLRATGALKHRADARHARSVAEDIEEAKTRRVISDGTELRRFGSVWYEVRMQPTPGPDLPAWQIERMRGGERNALPRVYDVLLKRDVCRADAKLYAIRKRQLNHRELARHGLT